MFLRCSSCCYGRYNWISYSLIQLDLPSLTQFSVSAPSFRKVTSFTLASKNYLDWLIKDVPFTEGTFVKTCEDGKEVPFELLTKDSIICDESSISFSY